MKNLVVNVKIGAVTLALGLVLTVLLSKIMVQPKTIQKVLVGMPILNSVAFDQGLKDAKGGK